MAARLTILLLLLIPDRVLADRCPGPPVDTIVDAALRHAGLQLGQVGSWRRRLSWAALLPRISGRVARSSSRSAGWDLGPRQSGQDVDSYLALRWEVRATWDLSRLVFDTREVAVSRRSSQLGQERRRLVQRVIRLYYERCSLLHLVRHRTGLEEDPQRRRSTRLLRVTALLNALTGGALAKELVDE